jgi:hypothetical protein
MSWAILLAAVLSYFLIVAADEFNPNPPLVFSTKYSPDWSSLNSRPLPKVKRPFSSSLHSMLTPFPVVQQCQVRHFCALGGVFGACLGCPRQVLSAALSTPHVIKLFSDMQSGIG